MLSEFDELLIRYSQAPEPDDRKGVEREIWDRFGMERAVFVLDMSGFSRLVRRYGVVHYLSMVRRMQMTARPVVSDFAGTIIKFEADNCFATFEDCLSAVKAAVSLKHAFDAANLLTADELDIEISCGIAYGPILVIHGEDFFGNAVNLASKLGEDIARSGEILITEDARERIPDEAGFGFAPECHAISGIEIRAFRVMIGDAQAEP